MKYIYPLLFIVYFILLSVFPLTWFITIGVMVFGFLYLIIFELLNPFKNN
ncbi:hypothetical protein KNV66_gp23 [Bacillus phage DLc1]|uniref:Uncharacterized protein n=1 Tax=Bacillus phage DLc1 TaxID=2777318 RepID=A0A7M1RTA7_9CAUD|nr:hypothetical protein KNV66_gp23 [Bacillus phage DLc1]QOR56280.1 hypothetical protein [Bacillus phage DLc1]